MRRLLLCCACALVSCAEPAGPRSTIQADAIAKSDLEGVWYYRQTVVGVPFSTGFTFVGEQGEAGMEKIRWDLQEDVLVARRAYEYVVGTEKGLDGQARDADGNYVGAPVAAFKVKSHFDIIREYNPSTGEEYDRLVESQERKWFERRFVRVDWSQNLVNNFDFLIDWAAPEVRPIRQEQVPYYVSNPKDPDAFRIERPDAMSKANYLEVTQKIFASPEEAVFEDGSSFPLCWLEYATQDCNAQEIRVRNSFSRITARDYEPLDYSATDMERFGFFTSDRKTYNRQYGLTETGKERLINRFNLFQRSMSQTSCRSDADCPQGPGARCVTELPDPKVAPTGAVSGTCAWPWAQRNLEDPANPSSKDLGPRKIVFYLNDAFPQDLKAAAQELERQYDELFKGIVTRATGKAPAGNVFRVCLNNPVKAGDPAECGPEGRHVRIGDVRYSMLYWVDGPTNAGLLGYGPNNADPETGEAVSANAFVYGAPIDEYSATARDLVRVVNGDLSPGALQGGANVRDYVKNTTFGTKYKQASEADVAAMASAIQTPWVAGLPKTNRIKKGNVKAMRDLKRARASDLAKSPVLAGSPGLAAQRLARLRGSDVEQKLVTPDLQLAAGLDPFTSARARDVNPLKVMNPERLKLLKQLRRRLSAHGVDLAATLDDSVLGFALKQKGADPNLVWRKIREQVFLSTALHEVGHTIGLRHNFAGSYDAMNYPKTYWDLRTQNGAKQPRPRYLDPPTQQELEGVTLPSGLGAGESEFMQSSIMDYGANFNSDIHGLGKYDLAAVKFGYGRTVEVFNTTRDAYQLGALQAGVTYGEALPFVVDCGGNNYTSVHYTKLPQLVDLESRSDVFWADVRGEVLSPQCAYPDRVLVDGQKRVMVPYKFCSDEFEGASTGCEAFDRGADVYEVASAAMSSYRNYYIFDAFKRDRMGFNPDEYLYRVYDRYFETLRNMMQFYALDKAYYGADIPDDGTPTNFWRSPDAFGPFTVAVTQGFDFLGEVLLTPEPGPYYLYTGADNRDAYYMNEYETGAPDFRVPIGQGRYFDTSWEYDSGYFWYERVGVVGSFLDKVAAIAELTDPETFFIGKDVAADLRQYSINYYRLFPAQITSVFAAALTGRWDRLAPVYDSAGYRYRPISQPITIPPANTYAVDPSLGFTVQLWMASLGVALIPATYDFTFQDSSRIWLAGNGSTITPVLPTRTFQDPFSGKQYVAVSYMNGILETGVAARMIQRATELQSMVSPTAPEVEAELRSYLQLLESMRSISDIYSDPVY